MEFKARLIKIDGNKLKQARGNRSQSEVCRKTGLSTALISQYENGKTTPPGNILAVLCVLYDVDIKNLIKQDEEISVNPLSFA